MKKIIIFVIVSILLGAVYILFFVFQKDNSKAAEIIDSESQTIEESRPNIVSRIIENEPALQNTQVNSESQPTQPIVKETTKANPEVKLVKFGTFNKIDPLHYASGGVVVEDLGDKYKLRFEGNFASAAGPDLFVYLSAPQDFKNIALGGVDTGKTLNLGVLKKQTGTQEYLISKRDFESHSAAIIIWCKQFGVQFSRADLN